MLNLFKKKKSRAGNGRKGTLTNQILAMVFQRKTEVRQSLDLQFFKPLLGTSGLYPHTAPTRTRQA